MVHTDTVTTVDSVPVMIPIARKVYRDSTYTAWVSGYHASLDSIALYQPTITIRQKPRKWSVGLSAGYGMTPQGLQPYVGVGVTTLGEIIAKMTVSALLTEPEM